jgi:hypothetical protein
MPELLFRIFIYVQYFNRLYDIILAENIRALFYETQKI